MVRVGASVPIRMKAKNGQDGTSAFVLDLGNERETVPMYRDSSGSVYSSGDYDLDVPVHAYYGTQDVNAECNFTLNCSDVDVELTGTPRTSKKFHIHISSDTSLSPETIINLTATHPRYGSRTAQFFLKAGAPGEPVFSLIPNLTAYKFARDANNALVAASGVLTVQIKARSDNGDKTISLGNIGNSSENFGKSLVVRYSYTSQPTSATAGTAFPTSGLTPPSDKDNIFIALFVDGSLEDTETIPILADGERGADGDSFVYNLLDGTSDWSGEWSSGSSFTVTSETKNGLLVAKHEARYGGKRKNVEDFAIGDVFTFSCWVKVSGGATAQISAVATVNGSTTYPGAKSNLQNTDWQRIATTFTVPSGCTDLKVFAERITTSGTVYLAGFKLERGSKATAWAPSLNDLKGEPGNDGIGSYALDLENENVTVGLDQNLYPIATNGYNKVGSEIYVAANTGNASLTKVELIDSNRNVIATATSGSNGTFSGTGYSGTLSLGKIEITFNSSVQRTIGEKINFRLRGTIHVTDGGGETDVTAYKTFKVGFQSAGKDGKSPTIFDLMPSARSIVKHENGTYSPESLTCAVLKRFAETITQLTTKTEFTNNGLTLAYKTANNSDAPTAIQSSPSWGCSTYMKSGFFKLFLYKDATVNGSNVVTAGTLIDEEEIAIVQDGLEGGKGADGYSYSFTNVGYCNSTQSATANNTTSPSVSGSWGDAPASGKYRWRRYRIYRTNGTSSSYLPSASTYYYECIGYVGTNGQSAYTWMKYADSVGSNGIPETMYDMPQSTTKYIGFAYNKSEPEAASSNTSHASNNPASYTWKEFVGSDGMDAWTIIVEPDPVIFQTQNNGNPTGSQIVKITVKHGTNSAMVQYGGSTMANSILTTDGSYSGVVKNNLTTSSNINTNGSTNNTTNFQLLISNNIIAKNTATRKKMDGSEETLYVPATSGFFTIKLKFTDTVTGETLQVEKAIHFGVNVSAQMSQFYANNNEFVSDYLSMKSDTEGALTEYNTRIQQNADSITAVASRTTDVENRMTTAETNISATANGLATEVSTRTALSNEVSSIKQTSNAIQLKVGKGQIDRRNIIFNSYMNHVDYRYGCATREVKLVQDRYYLLSVCGRISSGLANNYRYEGTKNGDTFVRGTGMYGRMSSFIFKPDWSQSQRIDHTSVNSAVKYMIFKPNTTGTFKVMQYSYPRWTYSGGEAWDNSSMHFLVEWEQLEDVTDRLPLNWNSLSSADKEALLPTIATNWSLAEVDGIKEPAVRRNLLNGIIPARTDKTGAIRYDEIEADLPNGETAKGYYLNSASASTDYADLQYSLTSDIEAYKTYTLSFWLLADSDAEAANILSYFYNIYNSVNACLGVFSPTAYSVESTSKLYKCSTRESGSDGSTTTRMSREWKFCTITFTANRGASESGPIRVLVSRANGYKFWIAGIKLEECGIATHGTEDRLYDTGIDIYNGVIQVTTDQFRIRNNKGDETASVNENGQLEVNSGIFKGEIIAYWPTGNPRISLNRAGGWLTYYYPDGSKMREDVIEYDEDGDVCGVFTKVYDTAGAIQAKYGWFSEGGIVQYWILNKLYTLTGNPTSLSQDITEDVLVSAGFDYRIRNFPDEYKDTKYASTIKDSANVTDVTKLDYFWNVSYPATNPNTVTNALKTTCFAITTGSAVPATSIWYNYQNLTNLYYRRVTVYYQGEEGKTRYVIYAPGKIVVIASSMTNQPPPPGPPPTPPST